MSQKLWDEEKEFSPSSTHVFLSGEIFLSVSTLAVVIVSVEVVIITVTGSDSCLFLISCSCEMEREERDFLPQIFVSFPLLSFPVTDFLQSQILLFLLIRLFPQVTTVVTRNLKDSLQAYLIFEWYSLAS